MLPKGRFMEFDSEQNSVPGKIPQFGAIFMSNSATKKECFRRKLLGLPSCQAHFVKQVKTGMILFLFEFERRELHGVFQACSDGAMNIVPHAFNSTGKQFPAQVKFTQIWHCSPLPESEFFDAIRENYFSAKKFNFGLSERQVRKLLVLFSCRKLKDMPLGSKFSSRNIVRCPPRSKASCSFDSGRFIMIDDEKEKEHLDGRSGLVISSRYPGSLSRNHEYDNFLIGDERFANATIGCGYEVNSGIDPLILDEQFGDHCDPSDKYGILVDDSRFLTRNVVGKEDDMDIEPRSVGAISYSENSFVADTRVPEVAGVTFGIPTQCNEGNGLQPPISTAYLGSVQSDPPVYSSKATFESNLLINDPLQCSSLVRHSVETQNSNICSSMSCGDAIPSSNIFCLTPYQDAAATSTLPFDPDVSSLGYRHSSLGLSNLVPERPSHDCIFPSCEKQTFPLYSEHKGTSGYEKDYCGLSDNVQLSSRKHLESCQPRAVFPDYVEMKPSGYEDFRCASLQNPSLTPSPFSGSGLGGRAKKATCSYYSNKAFPSPFDNMHPITTQDKFGHDMSESDNCEAFGSDGPMFREGKTRSIECYRNALGKSEDYQTSARIRSDYQNNGKSVFSRLALPPKVCEQNDSMLTDNGGYIMDSSVDEVVSLLHQSHYQWVGPKNYSRNNKQMTLNSKLRKNDVVKISKDIDMKVNMAHEKTNTVKISKEMNMDGISADEGNGVCIAQGIQFVNFKRRSKVQKSLDDANANDDRNEGVEKMGSFGEKLKRRKLIRPNFSKNEWSVDDTLGSQDAESKISQNFEIPDNKFQGGQEVKNIDMERGSSHEGDQKVKNCVVSLGKADEDAEESSRSDVVQNVPVAIPFPDESCNGEEGFSPKNPEDDGLLRHGNNRGNSALQESFPEQCGGETKNSIAHGELINGGAAEKLFQNVVVSGRPMSGEVATGTMMSISENPNSGMENVSEELKDSEGNNQLSVAGQCVSSFEAATHPLQRARII